MDELKKLEKDILKIAKKYPKITKKFLQNQGNQLKRLVKRKAKSKINIVSGNYIKGIKRGKVYKYQGDEDTVRVYNSMPHAHLIEYGHIIKDKNGKEHGFKNGYYIMEESEKEFSNQFLNSLDSMIDEVIKQGGF